jgi:1-deoxyxylulose-5-phosphate synthase
VLYVKVGKSGLSVSRIGLGMMSFGDTSRRAWHLSVEAARPIVRCAAESGVTFFDTADMYDRGASEDVTGELLAEVFPTREDYVLATKVYYPMGEGPNDGGLSRKHILTAGGCRRGRRCSPRSGRNPRPGSHVSPASRAWTPMST